MKKRLRLLSLMMALIMCVGALTACSSDDDQTDLNSDTDSYSSTDDTSSDSDLSEDDEVETTDVMGEITEITDTYITISLYEADELVEDYASLDTSALTATWVTEEITIDTGATYHSVTSGYLADSTVDSFAVGSMIAVTYDESGNQQIILLEEAENETAATETVAEVISVEDSILTLSIYEATATGSVIEDYAAIDLSTYADTYVEEYYELLGTETISIAEKGVTTSATAEDIATGDMVVIYTDDYGTTQIVVYAATADEDAA